VRLRSIVWAGVAGLAVAALAHSRALVLATLCACLLAVLVVVTRRRVFRALTFERTLSRRVVPWGGELEITLSVTNAKLLPLPWLCVRDDWPRSLRPLGFTLQPRRYLATQQLVQTVSLRWFERLRRRYRVRCEERGLHRFGPVELESGDPLGITGQSCALEMPEQLAVLPRVLAVPDFELVRGRPLVDETVRHSLIHDPTALRGMRAYVPGDPLRAINWRATARWGTLHTNEFDPATLAAARVLLNVGVAGSDWRAVEPALLELLCVVAASLAAACAEGGYGVGLASNASLAGGSRTAEVEAAPGVLSEVLEALACVQPAAACAFVDVLEAELADERDAADCVVVTAALPAAARRRVARLRAERATTLVYVGRPGHEEASLVDAVVPADFDWRTSDALPLLA
jgi:uncharacterized protein (DUF58 family)